MRGVDSARPKRSWIITCVGEDGNTEGRCGLVDSSFLVGTCLNNNICISGEKSVRNVQHMYFPFHICEGEGPFWKELPEIRIRRCLLDVRM